MLPDRSTIYRIDNSVTGHYYFGSTVKTIEQRLSKHFTQAKMGNCPLHRLIKKRDFKRDEFKITELEVVDFIDAKERESTYIRQHIRDPLCLNKRVEDRSYDEKTERKKQYYIDNKELYHQRYMQNREAILTKKKRDYHLKKYCTILGQEYGFEIQITF